MDRLIYIVGQAHSGSTLLDLLLSSGGKALSLGEIMAVVQRKGERIAVGRCSCGVKAIECDFWKPLLMKFAELEGSATVEQKYRLVFQRVDEMYGPEMHVIDSSKQLDRLKELEKFLKREIVPIQVVKDVRSFSVSMIDKAEKKQGGIGLLGVDRMFLGWYRRNRRIDRHLQDVDHYKPFRVVYEELVFTTDATAKEINEYLGGKYVDLDGAFESHIISGNRMREKIGTPRDIRYDFRWLARSEWLRPYLLLPFVSRYNSRIYKVLNEKGFDKFNLLYRK